MGRGGGTEFFVEVLEISPQAKGRIKLRVMFEKYEFKIGGVKVHFLTCPDLGFPISVHKNQHSAAMVAAIEIRK